jgi:hypothetical protein
MGLARRGFKSVTEDKMATGVEPVVHLVPEQQKYFQGKAFLDDACMLEEPCQYLRALFHSSAAIARCLRGALALVLRPAAPMRTLRADIMFASDRE